MIQTIYDFVVVGGGIAGASCAFELASRHKVLVLEAEQQPGYHSTGRSAAFYTKSYGNAIIRALTAGGESFFETPPVGFSDHPLLTPRGALHIARRDQNEALRVLYDNVKPLIDDVLVSDGAFARQKVPQLRDDYVDACLWEPDAREIDVHALLNGFIRGTKAKGGQWLNNARVRALKGSRGAWEVHSEAGTFRSTGLVNAAGAWADEIGALAGAEKIGLAPKRRSACLFTPPPGLDISGWPAVIDVDETFYFKPDAGKVLLSPADETPFPPSDAYPDDIDIAIAVDRLEAATHLTVQRIDHAWAGLRSFVADRTLVVGFDSTLEGFFWLAGQGGYGIQTAPAVARCVAALATGHEIPADLQALGVNAEALSPIRVQRAGPADAKTRGTRK